MNNDYLMHYGVAHDENPPGIGSGRFPFGSGKNPYQHEGGMRGAVRTLKKGGWTEKEIADHWGITIQELRDLQSIEKVQQRNIKREKALELFNKGKTYTEIGKELGAPESSIRSLLDPVKHERNNVMLATADMLRNEIKKNGMTDIGRGMSNRLGISETKLKTAIRYLQLEGYVIHNIPISQNGTAKSTTMQVICPPGTTWPDAVKAKDKVNIVNDPYTEDGGRTWENLEHPRPISASRIYVRHKEEGGSDKDGLIEIRPGVEDLDIGTHGYAQVRIAVSEKDNPTRYTDGTNYMKGVAIYSDAVPKGYDVIYNSNKSVNDPFDKVFKPFEKNDKGEVNWDNPFGASIKSNQYDDSGNLIREVGQKHYVGSDGKKHLSSINVVNEAGDWQRWAKRLSSQFLSKQRKELAERQLTLAYESKKRELDDIMALSNDEIKMKLLDSFAEDCDSAAVHLKAAPLPGQQSHVIIPVPEMKDYEIYAPNYKDGEIVSLVRHPHEGIFEIPTLVVNNRNRAARKLLGNAPDAVGINIHVANQLSGADFDGDTVLVLPNPNGQLIKSMEGLPGLKDFDTKLFKKPADAVKTGPKKMPGGEKGDGFNKQLQMGMISNLITDMTLGGASVQELARATKHSMVIIDSEKHNLDWKQSEKEYNIPELRKKYQPEGGVGTLISRAKSPKRVPERADFYLSMVDKKTGEINWRYTNRFKKEIDPVTKKYIVPDKDFMSDLKNHLENKGIRVDKITSSSVKTFPNNDKTIGEIQKFVDNYKKEHGYTYELAMDKSTKMAEAKDAYELSSGTKMEAKYANYANAMKALGNEARKLRVNLKGTTYNKDAKEKYKNEVASLMAKMNEAMKHKPLERKVQALADVKIKMLMDENPQFDKQDRKKHRARIVKECRQRMGTQKYRIVPTQEEWNAIASGALTSTKISDLFSLMDVDVVREYATPKEYTSKLSRSEIAYAKSLLNSGNYSTKEIADSLGISVSTLYRAIE